MPAEDKYPIAEPLFDDGKEADALRTIGEVSEALGVKRHVLRYWEQQFPSLRPMKRSGGRRYYRPEDVAVVQQINLLVNDQGYTLKGARKAMKNGRAAEIRKPGGGQLAGSQGETTVFSFSDTNGAAPAQADGKSEQAEKGERAKGSVNGPVNGNANGAGANGRGERAAQQNGDMSDSDVVARLKNLRDQLSKALDN